MTLKELKERVDYCYNASDQNHNIQVCVPNNKSGMMGGTPVTGIEHANHGIDWDSKKFILWPLVKMIEK